MHFSQSYDLAVHGLCCMAAQPEGSLVAAKDLAGALNAKLTYFAKVLQSLAHAGLVRAERGKLGGYGLKRPASEITLGDVIRALDSSTEAYPCPANRGCPRDGPCAIRGAFGRAAKALNDEFMQVTLAQIVVDLKASSHAPPAWLSVASR